ncbi:threonine/serine exporter family protein, partial [Escherichia coli]|nr:threonine/serine exporter family protein [Escherichia coli]
GIMPMLPGLAVFRAVFAFAVNDTPDGGLTQLLEAAATALALGSGVVLGEFLASPLRYGAGRIGDLFRIEGPPGLRRAVGRVVRLQPAKSQQPTGTGG